MKKLLSIHWIIVVCVLYALPLRAADGESTTFEAWRKWGFDPAKDSPEHRGTVKIPAPGPETKRELSVARKEVFEFTAKPKLTRHGDTVTISFECKDYCDATVAIEDATGQIVRHLASGVLGPNAPTPFEKNSLKQQIVWDGKNDAGAYVDDKQNSRMDQYTVRVSLGLMAQFEKSFHCNPKRRVGGGGVLNYPLIQATEEGVVVYQCAPNRLYYYVTLFDHDGRYLRTLCPFPADKLQEVKDLKWVYASPDENKIPLKRPGSINENGRISGNLMGTVLPFASYIFEPPPPVVTWMAVKNGFVAIGGDPSVARFGTDGTTRGKSLEGPPNYFGSLHVGIYGKLPYEAHRAALSPDGRYVYLARVTWWSPELPGVDSIHTRLGDGRKGSMHQAIYRQELDKNEAATPFIGEPDVPYVKGRWPRDEALSTKPPGSNGSPEDHFDVPAAVATDSKGRIYVADWRNDRVQVYTSDGKFFKTLEVPAPADLSINPKTGEMTVFTYPIHTLPLIGAPSPAIKALCEEYNKRSTPRVRKFGPIENPQLVYDLELPPQFAGSYYTQEGFSGISDDFGPEQVLWMVGRDGYIYAYTVKDGKLVLKCNFQQEVADAGIVDKQSHFSREQLFFDPKRQKLYLAVADECEMKNFGEMIEIDVATGKESRVKLPLAACDAGFDSQGLCYLLTNDLIGRFNPDNWKEVPFDYGVENGNTNISLIRTIGGQYSSYKYQSLGVSANGEVIVAAMTAGGDYSEHGKTAKAQSGMKAWQPKLYPGRPESGVCINVFDRHGKLLHEDCIPGACVVNGGIDLDIQGNIFSSFRTPRLLDGRNFGYDAGMIAKVPGSGARFVTDHTAHAKIPLDRKPERPYDAPGLWLEGANWVRGGTPIGDLANCMCAHGRFKVDYFGRSFVPEVWRYSVAVFDTAGNVIMRIGRYGNVDSNGPKSAVPLGGDEIGLMDNRFVTVHTDHRLFIGDMGNARVISAILSYHATEKISLKEVQNEAQ